MRLSQRRTVRKLPPVLVLSALLALVASGALAAPPDPLPPPAPPGEVYVQILALNDFHGNLEPPSSWSGIVTTPDGDVLAGGAEYLAAHVAALRAQNSNTVVVSAGDLIGASPLLSALFHDEPTIEAFNLVGLDYSAAGNHEFDEGWQELLRMQKGGCHPVDGCLDGDNFKGATFRYLTANVVYADSGKTLFPAWDMRSFKNVKVAFVGVSLEGTPGVVSQSAVQGLEFLDEADAVNALIPEMKKRGIETIVVLIHDGGGQGVESPAYNGCEAFGGPIVDIVERLDDEVDVVITGHTHNAFNCTIDGKLVTAAYSFGRILTAVDLTISRATNEVTAASANNLIVRREVDEWPAITALIERYAAIAAPLANRVIGSVTADIPIGATRQVESSIGDVVADSQLFTTADPSLGGAQIAFMNPGGVRAGLTYPNSPAGEGDGNVTYGEAFTVQPYSNDLVTLDLTGAQIDSLLEQQFNEDGSVHLMLQVSDDFTYCWDTDASLGDKVDPAYIRYNGAPIEPAATYRVVANAYLADGGDGFTVMAQGTNRLGGGQDLAALESYFAATSPVPPGPANRVLSAAECTSDLFPASQPSDLDATRVLLPLVGN